MTPSLQHNHDLSAAFTDLITSTSIATVMEHQPVKWRLEPWQRQWQMNPPLPHPQVLNEIQAEYAAHQRIRRSFVFSYQHRSPVELFITAMAWGRGTDNRGPAKVRTILTQPNATEAIEAVVNAVRQDGAAAGYSTYFPRYKLQQLNIAFITKVLYFAGYQSQHRPRPLIYDRLVANALIRMPDAPLLPGTWETVSSNAYHQYCCWAEQTAADHGTEPAVVEYALFSLGDQVRKDLP
jgi:hypothetical protein